MANTSSDSPVFAGLCCILLWSVMALAAGAAGHLRMRRVEQTLGHRAEPTPERVQLFYAGASIVWLSALVLAIVGFARRPWTRMGRNCLFIFLGHLTVVTVLVPFVMPGKGDPDFARVAVLPCAIVAVSSMAAGFFALRWSRIRVARIEAEPATGAERWGSARYALYLASLVMWPVGVGATLVLNKPENVRVGATACALALVQLVGIALLVCVALPLLIPASL